MCMSLECFVLLVLLFFFQSDPSEKYHYPRTMEAPVQSNKVGLATCHSQKDHVHEN